MGRFPAWTSIFGKNSDICADFKLEQKFWLKTAKFGRISLNLRVSEIEKKHDFSLRNRSSNEVKLSQVVTFKFSEFAQISLFLPKIDVQAWNPPKFCRFYQKLILSNNLNFWCKRCLYEACWSCSMCGLNLSWAVIFHATTKNLTSHQISLDAIHNNCSRQG